MYRQQATFHFLWGDVKHVRVVQYGTQNVWSKFVDNILSHSSLYEEQRMINPQFPQFNLGDDAPPSKEGR